MNWQPIETAPKDGTKVDLWAKTWLAETDTFVAHRFPFCYWRKADTMTGRGAGWVNLETNFHATHWMAIPEGPQ